MYSWFGDQTLGWVRIGLVVSGQVVLAICVLVLWLLATEQVRERRRAFALARASGVPLRTLGGSVLIESLAPVAVAVALAVPIGALLGWLIQFLLIDVGAGPIIDWDWVVWSYT